MKEKFGILDKFTSLVTFLSLLLVVINAIFIFLTERIIFINQGWLLTLFNLLLAIEFFRIFLFLLSMNIILRSEEIRKNFKTVFTFLLAFETFLNIYFLGRLFVYSCFAPSISFCTTLFVVVSFIMIKIEHRKQFSGENYPEHFVKIVKKI